MKIDSALTVLVLSALLTLAACGGSDTPGQPPAEAAAATTESSASATMEPTTDPNIAFANASRTVMTRGLRGVLKATDVYMSDLNAGAFSAASISAALVSIKYAAMRDRVIDMPEAGSTLGADTARVLSFCEERWSDMAKVVARDVRKATDSMEACTAQFSDLTDRLRDLTQ